MGLHQWRHDAGRVTDKGFYEAQWGYLLDANPDFVTDVAELYDLTGDKQWVENSSAIMWKGFGLDNEKR